MIITHDTTIEEYEAWLASNPKTSALRKAVKSTFKMIFRTIGRIQRMLRTTPVRSCLTPRIADTVFPIDYDHNGRRNKRAHEAWALGISGSLMNTQEHIRRLEMFGCLEGKPWAQQVVADQHARIEAVEDELAMEELKADALEILITSTPNNKI